MKKRLPNVHPGEVLLEEFLRPLGISQNRLARDLKVPPRRVNEITLGKRAITPDTALRLARYFGTSERFWLGLQLDYDLEEAQRAIGDLVQKQVNPMALAESGEPSSKIPDYRELIRVPDVDESDQWGWE